jgi:hypothetical protein
MKGLIRVTATMAGKEITSEVFGDLSDKVTLFARLMNRHKVLHSERLKWRMTDIKLIREICKN